MKIQLIFLLCFFPFLISCGLLTHRVDQGSYHSPPDFDKWLVSKGIFKYGITLEEVEQILAQNDYCGEKFIVKEVQATRSFKKKHPDIKGPFYGIFNIRDGIVAPNFSAYLISNGKIMEYGADYAIFSSYFYPLPGHPEIIQSCKIESNGDQKFADLYWKTSDAIKSFLKNQHTEEEVISFLKSLERELPQAMLIFTEATRMYHFIPHIGQIRDCEIVSKINWDKIISIKIERRNYYFKDDGTLKDTPPPPVTPGNDWDINRLANIYIKDSKVVGVIFCESTFYGCMPLGHSPKYYWNYPYRERYHFWTFK